MVEWTVENEINTAEYEVEKSTDGRFFKKANTTAAASSNRGKNTYTWLDVNPVTGENYYRIRSMTKVVRWNTANCKSNGGQRCKGYPYLS